MRKRFSPVLPTEKFYRDEVERHLRHYLPGARVSIEPAVVHPGVPVLRVYARCQGCSGFYDLRSLAMNNAIERTVGALHAELRFALEESGVPTQLLS